MLKNSKGLLAYDYNGATAFYLGSIVVTLLVQAAGGVVSSALVKAYPDIQSNGDFNTAFMVVIQLANLAFIYFYTRLRRRKFDFTFVYRDGDGKGVTPRVVAVPVICALILMIGMYLPTIWYGMLVNVMGVPEGYGNIELTTPSAVAMLVIASVLLAPCFEETIYRGVLLSGLKREKTAVKAALLSALAFMLMHMNPVQVVFQFALGVVSGFTAIKAKRLLPCVLLHATANALALIMQLTPLSGYLTTFVEWNMSHPAAAVFITLGLVVWAGGLLFVVLKYAYTPEEWHFHRSAQTAEKAKADVTVVPEQNEPDGTQVKAVDGGEIARNLKRSDGTFKYWIGIGICALMFIINFITAALS